MPAYLVMVLIAFTVFIAVLGVYATGDMLADARRRSAAAPRARDASRPDQQRAA